MADILDPGFTELSDYSETGWRFYIGKNVATPDRYVVAEKLVNTVTAQTIAGAKTFEGAIVLEDAFSVTNDTAAQYSVALAAMYSDIASLGNNAGAQFGSVIMDAGITQTNFVVDALDYLGAYHHNLLAISINTSAALFYGQVTGGSSTESFSATKTFDMNDGNTQQMTLTGNVTSLTLSNKVAGSSYLIYLIQDGTGSRTIPAPDSTFGTQTDNSVSAFITALNDINIINVNVRPDGTTSWTLETITA